MENLNKIAQTIKDFDNFLITSHVNPDGDAMGSMSAMGHLLQAMGKKFSIFNESQVPDRFNWINLPGPVENRYEPGNHSWMIVLDCGDFERSGKELPGKATESIINIDHHRGNPGFGNINWVDTQASSVGEMIADLADHLQININGPLAEGIYLALVSDTGFFTFGNTSPKVLELSARLIRNGIDPGTLNSIILNQWTIGRLRLHGQAMQNTLFFINDRVGIVSISQKMMEETGTGPDDCEGLVNAVRNVKSVDVAISLREDKAGKIKFSLRSTGDIDVQRMAAELQGGGHKNASGGTIEGSMEYARDRILDVVSRHLES
ncbi:MAG: DHH family phosphoesterase [Desulfonatronovibrio sp.]